MLLTTRQVSDRTGLSLFKIRQLIKLKKLHGIDTSVGTRAYYMVPEESLAAFLRGELHNAPKEDSVTEVNRKSRRIDADVPKVFS